MSVAVLSVLILITFATLGPVGLRPELTSNAALDRFVGFILVGLVIGTSFPKRRLLAAAVLIIFAGGLELGQLLTLDRDASGADWANKSGGALFGLVVIRLAEVEIKNGFNDSVVHYSSGRTVAMTLMMVAALAAVTWWTRSPPAAVRTALAAMPPAQRPPPDFVIDIWAQDLQSFHASVRGRKTRSKFLVMTFFRTGTVWQLASMTRRS